MKRHFIGMTALLVTAVLIFTGCLAKNVADMAGDCMESLKSSKSKDTSKRKEYIDPSNYSRNELLPEIIECFKSRDKERLNSYFNDYYRDTPILYADIDEAFDFIDGEIVACSDVSGDGGSRRDENFELIKTSYDVDTYILTDKGMEYNIRIGGLLYYAEDPKMVGLGTLQLVNKNRVGSGTPYGWWEHWRDYKDEIIILGDSKY